MIKFKDYLKEEYQRIPGTQYGSNNGGLHKHKETGKQFYIKFPRNEEQAKVEVATSKLYNAVVIKTLEPELQHVNGVLGVKSEWKEGHDPIGYSFHDHITKTNALDLAKMYHSAVIKNNRDVVGQEYDNILRDKSNNLISTDQGGSMHFRAMGEHKPFVGDDIQEFSSFRDPFRTSGDVFSHVFNLHPEVEKESIDHIKNNLTDDKIDSIISSSGLDKNHAETIKKRRDLLINKYK